MAWIYLLWIGCSLAGAGCLYGLLLSFGRIQETTRRYERRLERFRTGWRAAYIRRLEGHDRLNQAFREMGKPLGLEGRHYVAFMDSCKGVGPLLLGISWAVSYPPLGVIGVAVLFFGWIPPYYLFRVMARMQKDLIIEEYIFLYSMMTIYLKGGAFSDEEAFRLSVNKTRYLRAYFERALQAMGENRRRGIEEVRRAPGNPIENEEIADLLLQLKEDGPDGSAARLARSKRRLENESLQSRRRRAKRRAFWLNMVALIPMVATLLLVTIVLFTYADQQMVESYTTF